METETPTLQPNRRQNTLQIVSTIFQIHTNKPLSVKILQWIYLVIPWIYIQYIQGTHLFWWYDSAFVISFLLVFLSLYLYKIWSLYALRILGFFTLLVLSPLLLYFLINGWLYYLTGIHLHSLSISEIITVLTQIQNDSMYFVILFTWISWIIILAMIPFFIAYAFLWNQVDRYKYSKLKEQIDQSKLSKQTEMPL